MKINQILAEKLQIDPELLKSRVIRTLEKKKAEDPVFDTTYKLLVGKQLETRIQNYIASHEDADIGADEMKWLPPEFSVSLSSPGGSVDMSVCSSSIVHP